MGPEELATTSSVCLFLSRGCPRPRNTKAASPVVLRGFTVTNPHSRPAAGPAVDPRETQCIYEIKDVVTQSLTPGNVTRWFSLHPGV